jgi:hypothetical protein
MTHFADFETREYYINFHVKTNRIWKFTNVFKVFYKMNKKIQIKIYVIFYVFKRLYIDNDEISLENVHENIFAYTALGAEIPPQTW